jgi:hypothetical protein
MVFEQYGLNEGLLEYVAARGKRLREVDLLLQYPWSWILS